LSYIGASPKSATFAIDTFNGDGTTVNFTLRESPVSTSSILVFVGGVRQATDTYSLSGSTLAFTEAPPSGTNNIQVLFLGLGASPSIPSDGSVTTVKLVDASVTAAKLAPGAATPGANTIGTNELKNDAVQANNIATGAVTGDKIGLTAINANNIATGAVTGDKIGLTAINANNIVDATITSGKIASTISITTLDTTLINTIAVSANHYAFGVISSSNATINVAQSTYFSANTQNSVTWQFTGAPATNKATGFILELTASGSYTQTWPASVKWPGGTAPTLTSGNTSVDVLVFITDNAGTTWRGALAQANSA